MILISKSHLAPKTKQNKTKPKKKKLEKKRKTKEDREDNISETFAADHPFCPK